MEEKDPFSEFGGKSIKSDSDPFSEFGGKTLKKKELSKVDSGNTFTQLGNGSNPFPSSQVNTAVPSVLTETGKETYQKQAEKDQFLKDQLASQIRQAQNAYRTVQGDAIAQEVQSINEPKTTPQQPSFSESVANTGSNIITGLKAFIPNTAVAIGDGLQTVFGKDLASDMYAQLTRGGDLDAHRIEAYQRLEELEPQYKVTRGLIEAGEKFDIPGLAAATVDAVGSLVRSAVVAAPTAGLGLYADMMGGTVTSFNREKAKTMGISTQELYDRGENEFMIPATIGAVGARMEAFGLKGTKDFITRNLTGSAAKKLSLLFVDVNKEGLTEWVQTGLDKANESIAKGADATQAGKDAWNEMTSKKGLESYLMGVVGSGAAGGIGRMAKGILNPKARKIVEDNAVKAEELANELQKPDLSPMSRSFIDQEAQKIVSEIADAIDTDANTVEQLTPDQRKEVTVIQDEIQAREEVINDPALSETIKESAVVQVEELNKELDKVISKKPEKTVIDTEDKIIKEGKLAEAKFAVDGDQVTYEQKIKELEDRAKKLKEITKPEEIKETQGKSDLDIEKRMADIEGDSNFNEEFNLLEKEMEKRERESVFNAPLSEVGKSVDALIQKDKDMPNGFGSFIEKRDASETKEVAERYADVNKLTDEELKSDFSDAVRGNPTTWYADGLKLRESIKEASKRGIDTKEMIDEVIKVYTESGYDIETAKSVVSNMLSPILKGAKSVNEKQIEQSPTQEAEVTPKVIKEPVTQVTEQSDGKNETKGQRRQKGLLTQEGVEPGSSPSISEVAKQGRTEPKELNRIFSDAKKKYGEKEGSKYNEVVNRIVNPNQNTIIEVRSNGVVVKEGDKYLLKPFTNTDFSPNKWQLAKPLDVTEQYVTTEVEPVQEAIAEIKDKKRELVTMPGATDAQLKAQKKDMITQLTEVQSKFKDNDETQDRIIRAQDAGYKVSDKGQVTFEVEGDGTFNIHVDNIGEAIKEVQKAFPDKNPVKPDYKPKPSGATGKAKTTTTETELQDTRDNIAMAKKSGNIKLQEVFEKELERLSKLEIKDKVDQVTTKESVETESDKIIKGNEAIEKAKTDLSALKQVEDKPKKYNSAMTRLAEAKNAGYITEQEFNDFKKKFDQVLAANKTASKDTAAKLRSLKVDTKGKSFDATLGLPVAVWNGAIETVATAVEAGVSIADAVKRGINYIQKNHRGAWNKKAYNDRVIEELGLRGIEVNGQDLIVKPQEDKATVTLINGFYSPLEKGISEANKDKATGKEWSRILSGVTEKDELVYTGVGEFLSNNSDRVISKKELSDFMANNRIEVVEVVKGRDHNIDKEEAELKKLGYSIEVDMGGDYEIIEDGEGTVSFYELPDAAQEIVRRISGKLESKENDTKFSQYQLEGEKENYKEVLVTLPVSTSMQAYTVEQDYRTPNTFYAVNQKTGVKLKFGSYDLAKEYSEKLSKEPQPDFNKQFKSSHFDEPNILVHLRMNSRSDSEGNKVLFIEEVQSDWGQKGKKEGFKKPSFEWDTQLGKDAVVVLKRMNETAGFSDWRGLATAMARSTEIINDFQVPYDNRFLMLEWHDAVNQERKVSTAPFVTDTNSWVKLGLKTALKEAVAQGADKIAWTTGEQQNDRYDLSKQVDNIEVTNAGEGIGYRVVAFKNGEAVFRQIATAIELPSIIGKDLSQKIIDSKIPYEKTKTFQGVDLKVGGKGMKGFYGSPADGNIGIIGGVAKSLFKQEPKTITFNSPKNQEVIDAYNKARSYGNIPDALVEKYEKAKGLNSTQNSIDITPELKEAVKSGLPLFKDALTEAKDNLKQAKAKLDSLNNRMGIAQDPKEKAKALFEYHKALVDVARVYIQEGVGTLKEFAEQLGERVTKSVRDAWNEAKNDIVKSENDFINEQTEILDEKEAKTLGITKKELKRIQEEQGQTEYEPESKTTTDQDQATARRLISEGYNIADLIKKIEKGNYRATRVEVYILRDYYVSLTARNNSNPTPELLNERQRTLEVIRQAGLTAGQVVQAFDGLVAEEDNLSSYLTAESKYSELTQEEIRELSDKYNAAKEALDKLNELTEKAKREATEKQVQKMLDEEKRKNRTRKQVKVDFRAERAGYIDDFRKKLREIRQTQQAVIIPYAQELIAAAPFVRKMVDSYVREGIYDFKTILKGIHDDLKQDIPDLTEDDVRDIIAGQYVNPRNTRNGKLAEVRDLERQARLELQIERLEAGILDTPSRVEKKAKSDKIIELEKEVREIKKRHPELTYPSKLQSRKTWYNNRIKELQDQIRKGDYETVVPPVPVLLDQEALKLKDEYTKFKLETDERRRKKEYEALSELEKTGKKLRGLLDLRRAVQVSVDLSIPARQGISVMLNPRTHGIGVKGYQEMIASIRSRKNYDRLMFDIENDPMYLQSKEDGVVYNDVSNPNANNDEWHNNNAIIDKIPVLRDLVRGSEVAAAAWSNYVRLELYKRQAKFLEAKGKTRENAKSAYEDAAARLMVDTGRGKIPFLKDKNAGETDAKIKKYLSNSLFGPRLYSAIFRKLNPAYYFNPKVDKTVRLQAFYDMTGYVASQLLLGIMVAAAGGVVSLNPDDPDFLKARWGKRVVDLTAGQSVYIRTFLRVVKAAYMRADPDVSKPDADKYASYAANSILTFWRNKLAPNTSYGLSWILGKNSIGEKFDPWEIIKIYPMYGDDIIESFKSGNPLDGALVLGIGVLGLGYQEYSKDIRTARLSVYVRDEKTKKFLKDNKLRIQSDINQEVLDPKTGAMVAMTKEQSDEYEKIWGEYVATEIKDRMPELQEIINKDKKHEEEAGYKKKLPGVIGRIKSEATKIAKEEVMGVQPVEIRTIEINNQKYNLSDAQIRERKQFINQYMFKNRSRMIPIDKELRKAGLPVTPHEREKLLRSKALSDATDKIKIKYKKAQGMTLIDD